MEKGSLMANPDFISDDDFKRLEKSGAVKDHAPDFISDSDMAAIESSNRSGAAKAGLEHFGNAASLGYLPQIQAAAEPIVTKALDLVTGNNAYDNLPSYVERRDENIARLKQQEQDFPKASLAGTVGGGIAGGVALTPLMSLLPGYTALAGAKAAKDAGLMGKTGALALRTLGAMEGGAATGAVMNPGDIQGEVNPIQAGERGTTSALGAMIAAPLHLGSEGVMAGGKYLGNKLSDLAENKAARALGFTKGMIKRMYNNLGPAQAKDKLQEVGRAALDEGIVTPLAGPGKMAERSVVAEDAAGSKIGELINQAEQHFDDQLPIGIRPVGEERVITKGGALTASGVEPSVTVQPVESVLPGRVNAEEIATQLRRNPEISELAITPGMEGAASRMGRAIDTLSERGRNMSLSEAQRLRQGVDKSINYNKAIPEMSGAQKGFYEMRDAIRTKVNDIINDYAAANGLNADELLALNRKYGLLEDINRATTDRVSREAANRFIGLTDTIMGGAGAGVGAYMGEKFGGHEGMKVGGLIGAGVGGLGNKFARTYGNQIMATSANRLSRIIAKSPVLADIVAQNPGMAPALMNALIDKETQKPDNAIDRKLAAPKK